MDFFLKNLRETLSAINKLIENNIYIVNTKRVRRCNNIKSSNRSKINFIWRSLAFLEENEILELNGKTSPKTYKIVPENVIDIEQFIKKVDDQR
ncbi:MAG: hypothetical protein BAJALOKI3v1_260033 [Promethearchaeota archaeon]|jgi:hypothetical protein|nr:MAG: hypothetical protein BAJALOKI3v1_260033 [Candidatus Lokiarchaeota archaeon]